MLHRLITIVLIVSLSACASLKKSESELDPNALPPTASGSGESVVVQQWNGIGGGAVRNLTRNAKYPGTPSSEVVLEQVDFSTEGADNFGRRITGLMTVNSTGDYQFKISADHSAELWLSVDGTPINKRLIAFTNKPTGYRVWDKFGTQTSQTIPLEQGEQYFIEVLHKEKTGDDYLVVEWGRIGGAVNTLSGQNLIAYSQPQGGDSGEGYLAGYHVGYHTGVNALAYDATYPVPDQDNDGLPDFYELLVGTDPNDMTDALADTDGDLLTTYDEYLLLSSPTNADTDGDSIPDGYEVAYGMSLLDSSDAVADLDGDGVSNVDEYLGGTAPNDEADYPVVVVVPEPTPEPDPVPTPEPTEPSGGGSTTDPTEPTVERVVTLSWEIPTRRQDGSNLELTDIQGYRIYSGTSQTQLATIVNVDNPTQRSYSENRALGTYYFSISTIDAAGMESTRSDVISLTVN